MSAKYIYHSMYLRVTPKNMSHTSSAYAISMAYLVMRPYQKYRVQFRSAVCTMINSVWSRCREWLLSRSEGWRAYPVRRD